MLWIKAQDLRQGQQEVALHLGFGELFTTSYHKNLLHNKAQDLKFYQIHWDNLRNRKWAYNLLEVLCEGLDWIDLAQYSETCGQLWSLWWTFWFHKMWGIFEIVVEIYNHSSARWIARETVLHELTYKEACVS
jgi:hypothetical protein